MQSPNVSPRVRYRLALAVAVASVVSIARTGDGGITIESLHPPDEYYFDYTNVTGGRIYVGASGKKLDCHLRYELPQTSGTITNVKLVYEGHFLVAVQYVYGEGFIRSVPISKFQKVDAQGKPCVHNYNPAAKTEKRGKPQPSEAEFRVSNAADAFDVTCDGKFAVVVGSGSSTPVSLVDLATGTEVDTFADTGIANNVAICDDGESILVSFVDAAGASSIRRLRIVAGALVDTGEKLAAAGTSQFRKVLPCPGSKTGLALVNEFGSPHVSRLVSFGIPGLAKIDSADFAGDAHSAALAAAGDRAYVSGAAIGSVGDTIKGFAYDPVTGALGDTANLTIGGLSSAYPRIYENVLAVTPDGTRLIVSEPADVPTQQVPTPQVTFFDATSGARADKFDQFEQEDFLRVRTIGTARSCGPATPCADVASCLEALRIALPDPAAASSSSAKKTASKLAKSLAGARKKAEAAANASGTQAGKLFAKSAKALGKLLADAHAAFRKGNLPGSLAAIDDGVLQFFDHLP